MNLSICIPGYNRPGFLRYTLHKLKADFPDAEVIVSDDGSTWNMSSVSNTPGIRWIQQPKNIGAFPNHRAALQAATRKYAMYCADDDYPLAGEVQRGIEYLDAHPECSAYIAPCEIWDEVSQTPFWNAFNCKECDFTQEQGRELFNFIIESHIWPEHVIYRAPVPLSVRTRAYWCFTDLVDLLSKGYIHFSPVPFYRNLLVHPVGEREQLGNVQCLTFFDEYRAGLEVLAYGLFGQIPYAARHRIHEMISHFICQRMYNAAVLYQRNGHTEDAQMLQKRIVIANPQRDAA